VLVAARGLMVQARQQLYGATLARQQGLPRVEASLVSLARVARSHRASRCNEKLRANYYCRVSGTGVSIERLDVVIPCDKPCISSASQV